MEPFNLSRKIFHSSSLLGAIFYYFEVLDRPEWMIFEENTRSITLYFLLAIVLIMLLIEFLRFRFAFIQSLFMKMVGPLLKERETDQIHGALPYMAGLAAGVALFPKSIVVCATLILLIGDPFAAYIGGKYGKNRFSNGKSMEGTLGGILAAFSGGFIFLLIHTMLGFDADMTLWAHGNLQFGVIGILAAGAVIGFITELFAGAGIFCDDNFVIPISSGAVMNVLWVFYSGQGWQAVLPDPRVLFLPI